MKKKCASLLATIGIFLLSPPGGAEPPEGAVSLGSHPVREKRKSDPAEKKPLPPDIRHAKYGPYERNILNFWRARSRKPTPVVVYIHGGGWHGGTMAEALPPAGRVGLWNTRAYLKAGISVASIAYRLTPKNPLPAPVYDAARAIQFIRSKAREWNLDKRRLVVEGRSAGATTSLWLAYHDDLADPKSPDPVKRESTKPALAVAEIPQTCIDPKLAVQWVGPRILEHYMIPMSVGLRSAREVLAAYDKYKAVFREFSPYFHVDKNDPPTLLLAWGSTVVPAVNKGHAIHHPILSWKLKQKADRVGAKCDFILLSTRSEKPLYKFVVDYVESKLLGPPARKKASSRRGGKK